MTKFLNKITSSDATSLSTGISFENNMESIENLWNDIEGKPKRLVTAIVIGCGQRGQNYSQFSLELPNWLKLVAVADPFQHRREKIAKSAGIHF